MNDFNKDFMRDVARGDTMRPLSQQRAPSACWMKLEDIQRSPLMTYDPLNPGKKVLLGALGSQLIGVEDNRHMCTVAGNRSGKSVGLIGNLFFYRGSVLATDPKGELARLTAAKREKLGQKVYVLDPFGIAGGAVKKWRASYNPMDILQLGSQTFLEDATLIAQSMVVQEAGQKDPHWDETSQDALTGWIAHVVTAPEFEGRRNLLSVRDLVIRALVRAPNADAKTPPALYGEMVANAISLERNTQTAAIGTAIRASAESFYSKRDSELSGVYSTIGRHTEFLNYTSIRSVLKSSDFSLRDLKADPSGVTIYLCFPATRSELAKRWMRLFINQLLDAMERQETVPPAPVLVCLDEFPVLGYMKQIEVAAGQIASFHVKLWFVLQDWSQGKSLYKTRWETFAANAGVMQFFGNTDLTTCQYITGRLGKTQVQVSRRSDVSQEQQTKGLSGQSESVEMYDLLTPDEVTRQFARSDRLKRQLIMWSGYHPMILQRVEYHNKTGPLVPYLK